MTGNSKLQKIVDRIERLDATIKDHNAKKSEAYKDARSEGYEKHEAEETIVETYLAELN